jgi:transcriptional regulator with XRE-family HTH domain
MAIAVGTERAGDLLREWRHRRSLSQLDLASRSAVSTRHLSFIETGRARPSREMLLHLAQRLEMPLRERNRLLLAAGFAPVFGEHTLDAPEMEPVRAAIDRFLAAHDPYPAAVYDRHWTLVASNKGTEPALGAVAPELLEPPINVLRVMLHPEGMAKNIVNFGEWSAHSMLRLERAISISGDPYLVDLYEELAAYPRVKRGLDASDPDLEESIIVPMRYLFEGRELRFFNTVTSFGTPLDVTVADLVIDALYPADSATADALAAIVPESVRVRPGLGA